MPVRGDFGTSNRALAARAEAASRVLAAHGVARGTVVAVRLPNRTDLVAALFAAWRLGAAVTPVNPALADDEVEYQVAESGARVLVTREWSFAGGRHDTCGRGTP